ncbi:hypothetical protein CNEO2_480005 [Clostridium neonatale]|nr:hypothetical protein [Clostridium neonatale]CAI3236603.1 hypothetical protein CNEO2_230047 [Clostridium neonatale]CAI3242387.1 hypothetical protein CNEO2_480005 [Clostridium neonatale]CAI3552615.1 hypothetical protein CNEO4_260048 [Clostridium neonatale]
MCKINLLHSFYIFNLLDVLDDETIAVKTGLDIEEVKVLRDKSY